MNRIHSLQLKAEFVEFYTSRVLSSPCRHELLSLHTRLLQQNTVALWVLLLRPCADCVFFCLPVVAACDCACCVCAQPADKYPTTAQYELVESIESVQGDEIYAERSTSQGSVERTTSGAQVRPSLSTRLSTRGYRCVMKMRVHTVVSIVLCYRCIFVCAMLAAVLPRFAKSWSWKYLLASLPG